MAKMGLVYKSTVEELADEARRLSGTSEDITPQEAVELLKTVTPGSGAMVDETLTIKGAAADAKVTGDRLARIEESLSDLLYEAISINSFTNDVNTVEIGTTITDVSFAWNFNKKPSAVTFDGEAVENESTGIILSGLNITSNRTWTLKAIDERDAVATKSTSVTFLNGVYYGVLADGATVNSSAVLSLSRKLQSGRGITFNATAGSTQRIAYAIPSRYGTPMFKDVETGFQAGFYLADTIQFKNASGYTEAYDVWLSTNPGLGAMTVSVS